MTDIPKKVFIVPYRNRPEQKFFFCKYMKFLLEYVKDYQIYFSHQVDDRSFNRGACRNIGFLAIKEKYPEHYQDMTFIFNDLDTIPFNRIFDYETEHGVVKHYYGFTHSLGGIVVIKGKDFEDINGYPNFWSWGLEDSCLQKRCETNGIKIDRSNFYKIGAPQMLQLFDGVERIINKKDPHKLKSDDGSNGLSTINNLDIDFAKKSTRELDNLYDSLGNNFHFINIKNFTTETDFEDDEYFKYDLREPTSKITNPDERKKTTKVDTKPSEWSNISYYPTTEERNKSLSPPKKDQTIPIETPPNPPQTSSTPQKIPSNPSVLTGRSPGIRSGLQAMQQGRIPIRPTRPVTRHLTSTFEPTKPVRIMAPNSIPKNESPVPPTTPASFKQMKKDNSLIFPPKTINTPGGASALNRINVRYRNAKM